jgi:hypothetical protein
MDSLTVFGAASVTLMLVAYASRIAPPCGSSSSLAHVPRRPSMLRSPAHGHSQSSKSYGRELRFAVGGSGETSLLRPRPRHRISRSENALFPLDRMRSG